MCSVAFVWYSLLHLMMIMKEEHCQGKPQRHPTHNYSLSQAQAPASFMMMINLLLNEKDVVSNNTRSETAVTMISIT